MGSPCRTALSCARSAAGPRLAQYLPWKPPRRPPSHDPPGAVTRPCGGNASEAPAGVGRRQRPVDAGERGVGGTTRIRPGRGHLHAPHELRGRQRTSGKKLGPPLWLVGRGRRRATPLPARVRLRSATDGGPSPAPSRSYHGHGGGA